MESSELDVQHQIISFLNTLLNYPNTSLIVYDILSARGFDLVTAPSLNAIIQNCVPKEELRTDLQDYLLTGLEQFKRQYFLNHHTSPSIDLLKENLFTLLEKWKQGITTIDPVTLPVDSIVPLSDLNLSVLGKTKSNKEQGIFQFISLCREVKTITSSVDMYNMYRRWCISNGYGYYSAPTLTKYLRASDKRHLESVSEKGRSQGWYLILPSF